jgi:ribosomal protein L15
MNRRLPKRGFKNIFRENYRTLNLYRLQYIDITDLDIPTMEKMD